MTRQLMIACLAVAASAATATAATPSGSWLFLPGNYTHHPVSGERVDQYTPLPTIAAMPDTRGISSGYRQSRVTQFGADGTVSNYYRVDNWGNDRGGLDAQWERVNDVWQQSVLQAQWGYGQYPQYGGNPYYGNRGPGYGGPGYGGPGYGAPGYGGGPGYGATPPGYGGNSPPGYAPYPGYGVPPGYGTWNPGPAPVGPDSEPRGNPRPFRPRTNLPPVGP
jgi:hypothetical protein